MTTSAPQPSRQPEAELEAAAEKRTPFWRAGLRVRLLAVITLALVPMLVVSAFYTYARFEAASETQRELLAARAQLTAQSQRQVILGAGAMMSALAQQAPVRLGGALCARALAQAQADQPAYANVMRINAAGHVACSAQPLEGPVRFDEASWFIAARDTGRFVVGALEIDPVTNAAIIRAVNPVFDQDGAFSGALTTGIRLQVLQQSGRERAGAARAALVDREGRLLTESRELGLARVDSELLSQAVETGSARFTRSASDGSARIFVLVPLLSTELYALLAEPAPQFLDFATVDLAGTLLLPLAMLVLAGTVIWMATDIMVLRWLRYLRRLASAYGRGRYSVRSLRAAAAPSELRELAASFDTMASSIAERDEALAQVAALMRDRADLAQIIDNAITPNDAETHRLLLDGTYHTGPVVDWVHRVMIAMRDLLRQDPSKAQAALEAYGREMVQRASEAALAVLINDPDSQPSLAYRVERAILAATEKEADHG